MTLRFMGSSILRTGFKRFWSVIALVAQTEATLPNEPTVSTRDAFVAAGR